ncbi:MAG: hypothetical protein AAFU85_28535 [Planctomycetota bacterium]
MKQDQVRRGNWRVIVSVVSLIASAVTIYMFLNPDETIRAEQLQHELDTYLENRK